LAINSSKLFIVIGIKGEIGLPGLKGARGDPGIGGSPGMLI
jgi:hypothetical protein